MRGRLKHCIGIGRGAMRAALILLLAACLPETLYAQSLDYFTQDNFFTSAPGTVDGLMNYSPISLDETQVFTPPIAQLLLKAGYDLTSNHWCEMPSTKVRPEDEVYHTSLRWKMQRELRTPQETREPFADKFEDLERRVKKMFVTRAKERRDNLMEHY